MKTFLIFVCVALLLSSSAVGQTTAADEKHRTVAELTALLQKLAAGLEKRDTTVLGPHYAAEYHHYNPERLTTRKKELAFVSSRAFPFSTVALVSPVELYNYGSSVVTVATMKFGGTDKASKAFTSFLQMMTVWVKRDGRWQMSLVQSKELPIKS